MYRYAFKLPSIRTRGVRVVYPKAAHIMTPGSGSLCRCRTQSGDLRILGASRNINGHQNTTRRIGTSLKRRHCAFYVWSFIVRCQSLSLHCIIKRNNGSRADIPRSCRCQCTVRAKALRAANMSTSWLIVFDVIILFYRSDLTISLSCRVLVTGGRRNLTCHSAKPSVKHWFHIRMTVDGCQSVRRAL